jgi:hypothetical protein
MMSAKFFVPNFNEWRLFGKQPWVVFGSTRPFCDIQVAEKDCSPAAGFGCEADFYVRMHQLIKWFLFGTGSRN